MINNYEVIKNNKVVFSGSEEACNSYIINDDENDIKIIPSLSTIKNAKYDSSFSNDRSEIYIDNVEFVKIGKNKWEKHLSGNSALGGIYSNEEVYDLLKKSNDIEYDTLLVESKSRKKVNIFLGRFQPFTKGHLKVLEIGYNENQLPTVVLMIQNKKIDKRHPFPDEVIQKEIKIIKKDAPHLIKDIIYVKSADILAFGEQLHQKGYEPILWLTGTDRLPQYTRMATNYKEKAGFVDEFTTFEIKRTDEDISATKVREAIQQNDLTTYKLLMPEHTDKMFDTFRNELLQVKEGMQSLASFIKESIYGI